MGINNVERWVSKKLDENIDKEVIRDVLRDKGFENDEINRLLDAEESTTFDESFEFSQEDIGSKKIQDISKGKISDKVNLIVKEKSYLASLIVVVCSVSLIGFFIGAGGFEYDLNSCERDYDFNDVGFNQDSIEIVFEIETTEKTDARIAHYFSDGEDQIRVSNNEFYELEEGSETIDYSIDLSVDLETYDHQTTNIFFDDCGESISVAGEIGDDSVNDVHIASP